MNENYFNELIEAIKTTVKSKIPEFKSIEVFGGGFNGEEDLRKFTTLAPACVISTPSFSKSLITNANQIEATLDLSLAFATKDVAVPNSRHTIALTFLYKTLELVKNGRWGVGGLADTERESVSINNFYGQVIQRDVALWSVRWQQKAILGKDRFDEINEGVLGELEIKGPDQI